MVIVDFLTSFWLGLLTPLGALCVLPLLPGFLAYLVNKIHSKKKKDASILVVGLLASSGVIIFMFVLGLLFTTILQKSLTKVISIVSPIAFGLLVIISLVLIFNIEIGNFFPKVKLPATKNPSLGAFVFGFFFGAIVIPCNPAFIAAMFTKTAAVSATSFVVNILNFFFFGMGIATPIFAFSLISAQSSTKVIRFLTKYRKTINIIAGMIMLAVSLYYLFFVFKIHLLLM
ncbi:cytochrome C biogenesis protein [Candidatus Woesearchaeota archaeon]|nr:cytochrome C biogenesis protein [Candidatus Woesearchaeota archaeon]